MNSQVANVVFFTVTVYFLVEHWRNASTLTKSGENKGNFLIVIKLFFIMGMSTDQLLRRELYRHVQYIETQKKAEDMRGGI